MTMADRIVVLNSGRIEQVGTPLDLYRSPANLFVAGFIGSPRMNFVNGAEADKLGAATLGIRPEHLTLSRDGGAWKGTVGIAEHLGSDTFLHVRTEGIGQITARATGEFGLGHGETVYLTPQPDKIHRFGPAGESL
jgi:multiple sugar transport system ATP-binding protein